MGSLTILTGCYGSGKSETAIQMAMDAALDGAAVSLVDMDLINPYFKSSLSRQRLEDAGVRVIAPRFSGSGIEAPSLPPEMRGALMDAAGTRVVDLGGDAAGATVLGSFAGEISRGDYEFLFVLNPYRPYTSCPADAMRLLETLQAYARLPITGIINNANMVEETTAEHLAHGDEQCAELSRISGLPVVYHCAHDGIADSLPALAGKLIRLNMSNRPRGLF